MNKQMCLCEAWERYGSNDTVRFRVGDREITNVHPGWMGATYDGIWRINYAGDRDDMPPRVVDGYMLVRVESIPVPQFDEPAVSDGDTPTFGMEPVAAAAAQVCGVCGGLGEIKAHILRDNRVCPKCNGTGVVYPVTA